MSTRAGNYFASYGAIPDTQEFMEMISMDSLVGDGGKEQAAAHSSDWESEYILCNHLVVSDPDVKAVLADFAKTLAAKMNSLSAEERTPSSIRENAVIFAGHAVQLYCLSSFLRLSDRMKTQQSLATVLADHYASSKMFTRFAPA